MFARSKTASERRFSLRLKRTKLPLALLQKDSGKRSLAQESDEKSDHKVTERVPKKTRKRRSNSFCQPPFCGTLRCQLRKFPYDTRVCGERALANGDAQF